MAVAVSVGQLLIKIGSARLCNDRGLLYLFWSFFNLPMFIGGLLAVASPLLYFFALSRIGLARAYGFTGLSYLFTLILSVFVLKEEVPRLHWVGVLIITAGVFIWNL